MTATDAELVIGLCENAANFLAETSAQLRSMLQGVPTTAPRTRSKRRDPFRHLRFDELRLVVDQLDENDAFAFALTCRELPRRRLPRRLDHRPLR